MCVLGRFKGSSGKFMWNLDENWCVSGTINPYTLSLYSYICVFLKKIRASAKYS
jgi:hypothetical protein